MHLIGRLTGYKPHFFTYFVGSDHICENHLDMLQERIKPEPYPLPELVLSDRIPGYAVSGKNEPEWLEKVEPVDFVLGDYRHHPQLTAPMAV